MCVGRVAGPRGSSSRSSAPELCRPSRPLSVQAFPLRFRFQASLGNARRAALRKNIHFTREAQRKRTCRYSGLELLLFRECLVSDFIQCFDYIIIFSVYYFIVFILLYYFFKMFWVLIWSFITFYYLITIIIFLELFYFMNSVYLVYPN